MLGESPVKYNSLSINHDIEIYGIIHDGQIGKQDNYIKRK